MYGMTSVIVQTQHEPPMSFSRRSPRSLGEALGEGAGLLGKVSGLAGPRMREGFHHSSSPKRTRRSCPGGMPGVKILAREFLFAWRNSKGKVARRSAMVRRLTECRAVALDGSGNG